MSDEFKKLDALMARTIPELKTMSSIPTENKFKSKGFFLTALLGGFTALLVCITVINKENQKISNLVELSDVLMWDITSDETPDTFENTIAFLDD